MKVSFTAAIVVRIDHIKLRITAKAYSYKTNYP